MNCADLEILFCDYLDGTLASDARVDLERHLAGCARCAAMARDASAAVAFIDRTAKVEPPPQLLTRILFELPLARHARAKQPHGFRRWLDRWVQPVLQPRFAMGFAMTILSFSLLGHAAGIGVRNLTADDLNPARIWQRVDEQAYRSWQHAVKFYEKLRFVYEIQTQLREWTQKEKELRGRAASAEDAMGTLERQQHVREQSAPAGPASKPRTGAPEMRNER